MTINIYFLIVIVASIICVYLGSIVLISNKKSKKNLSFFLSSLCASMWIISLYITESHGYPLEINKIGNALSYIFAYLSIMFFYIFSYSFLSETVPTKKNYSIFILLLVGFAISALPTVHGDVKMLNDGQIQFITGSNIYLYLFTMILIAIWLIYNLIRVYKYSNGQERVQASLIIYGFLLTFTLVLGTNVILPALTDNWELAKYAPLFIVFIISFSSYAILKQKLFDIRLAVVRLSGYILSITLIIFVFSIIVLLASNLIFERGIPLNQEIFFAILIIISSISFQYIINYFNKLTQKIFYQDNYDPQKSLNDLNAVLVKYSGIQNIIDQASFILENNLKPTNFSMIIQGSDNKEYISNKENLIQYFDKISSFIKDQMYKTNNFESLKIEDKYFSNLFKNLNISLITKLTVQNELVGFIVIGDKKSGTSYTQKDIQFIETAADSIAIATQNALRYEEIAVFNATLQKRIDVATADLRKTNEKLKALDEAKDDFISMASHQLRTPLTSVKGYLSMVLEGDAGPINDLQRKFLSQSFISSQRMVFLISDLLNASRLKTGKFVIENKETYIPDIVGEELSQLEETIKARGLTLEYKKPKSFPVVNIDENKIRQVIMNFVDNAIYYTPSGGKIVVKLRATHEVIEYTVQDSGIGVPKDDQKHLFTKFYRAGNAKKARPDGTGLGIFMAKKVIIAQGGALIFKSEEGKGSVFGFSFPLKKIKIK